VVSIDHFRQGLLAQMARAAIGGRIDVLINSGELYRSLGGYPGSMHGMPSCCDAMRAEMKPGDTMVLDQTNGAGMTVRYLLPRKAH
jgi:5-methylcytosine-specific restriction protein A